MIEAGAMYDEFEWDPRKAEQNYAKHGVRFEDARDAFSDPFLVEGIDDREDYGEDRFWLLGMGQGRILYVAYAESGIAARLISAREAVEHERRRYRQGAD